jgi:hypothetical protein
LHRYFFIKYRRISIFGATLGLGADNRRIATVAVPVLSTTTDDFTYIRKKNVLQENAVEAFAVPWIP